MRDDISRDFSFQTLLDTEAATVWDVECRGSCRHKSAEECIENVQLVFPYRGVYVRHLGNDEALADANQVLLFNAAEGYRVSHPVAGGDASMVVTTSEAMLEELTPKDLVRDGGPFAFRRQRRSIDARAQALVALLRHSLHSGAAEPLEAEGLSLTLVQRALGPRVARERGASWGSRKLVDRVKLTLACDLSRRWTLGEIAAAVGGSPVYLTQVFQRVEGIPLYRYQLGLRLARSLDLLQRYDDLSALGQDLGFSSHSHFSAAFRRAYGRTPSAFKRSSRR